MKRIKFCPEHKKILLSAVLLALSTSASTSHAYGIPNLSVYTSCQAYAAATARADLIGSIPGASTEERHMVYLQARMSGLFGLHRSGLINSGWQLNQAVAYHYYWNADPINIVIADARYYTYNRVLGVFTTNGAQLNRSYYC